MSKMQYSCSRCDSTSIYREATAYWDVETQSWKLSDDLSDHYGCGDCGWTGEDFDLIEEAVA